MDIESIKKAGITKYLSALKSCGNSIHDFSPLGSGDVAGYRILIEETMVVLQDVSNSSGH